MRFVSPGALPVGRNYIAQPPIVGEEQTRRIDLTLPSWLPIRQIEVWDHFTKPARFMLLTMSVRHHSWANLPINYKSLTFPVRLNHSCRIPPSPSAKPIRGTPEGRFPGSWLLAIPLAFPA
jgi:hypothetical protein